MITLYNRRQFDVIILVGPNDYNFFNIAVIHARQNIIGIHNLYLISQNAEISMDGCISIDEGIFPFTKNTVDTILGSTVRAGWYLQQLIKLYAGIVIPDITPDYLVIDADTVFLKPTTFFEGNIPLYNTGTQINDAYFQHMYAMHPSLDYIAECSGICHHMIFQCHILRHIMELIEIYHNKPFYQIFLECISPLNVFAGASEYEIYFNFLHIYYEGHFKIRSLIWKNSDDPDVKNYDYISHHWYLRGEENV
jgi:hypothetical protein